MSTLRYVTVKSSIAVGLVKFHNHGVVQCVSSHCPKWKGGARARRV